MTGTGLVVFLPLVGAFVGAIIGAWANSWYRDREAKKAQDRELKGLLILLDSEVYFNEAYFRTISNPSALIRLIRTDVWDESKVKLGQLLPPEDARLLTYYYVQLQLLPKTTIAENEGYSEDDKETIGDIVTAGNEVRGLIRSYGVEATDLPEPQNEGIDEDSTK